MKKIMKKIIAIICAITMVVSSVTIYNNTANAAVADLPESGPGVVIEVRDFGAGDILFLAGLDTITGATSYTLYVDGTRWGSVMNGANLELTNFPSGAHTFCVTGVNADGVEIAKSRDISVTIPNHGTVTTPEVVDGEELLKGTAFTDADTTTGEANNNSLWNELGGTYTNNGDGSVSVAVPAYQGGDNWATQLKQNQVQLIKDKWYVAKFTVTSDVDKKIQLLVQHNSNWAVFAEKIVSVAAGTTEEVELTFQATQTTDSVLFGFMMGYVDNTACEAANVTISNVSLKGYNAEPNGGEVPSDETTTPDGSGEQPSDETTTPDGSGEQPSDETTTPGNIEPAGPDYTEAAGSEALKSATYLAGEVGANQYKAVLGKGVINEIVSIQKFGAATDYGIYVSFFDASFGEMTVNGKPLNVMMDGAGIIMYLSNFEYMYNDVVINSGDGSQKAVIYVYNAQGIDNSDKVIEVPTEPTTAPSDTETTTPGSNQTSQDDRTYAAAYDWLTIGLLPSGIEEVRGKYRAVCGSGQIQEIVNIQQAGNAAEPGIYVTFQDANFGEITVNGVPLACNIEGSGITMYVSNFEYMYSDVVVRNGDGTEKAVIYVCNWGGIDNSDKAIGAPVEPTTPQATTPQATTPQATTPQATTPQATTPQATTPQPTTVAPTTATPTTVAPTTATASKVVAPKKTSVKSASKKKAAKKVKLSIKKVKGANGYRVQFSKTKKFKKVLVTKNVKKATVAISNKKLKNVKKLYVRVKAYKLDGKKKVLAKKWSVAKKVKIKK